MNKMSDFIKQMGGVPEGGLQTKEKLKQIKEAKEQGLKSGNNLINHMRAYQEVCNGGPLKEPVQESKEKGVSTLVENDTTKLVGALQVVKELLDCNLTENTIDIATKVKKIISKI